MNWQHHYTGIDICNPRGDGRGLYMHRRSATRRVEFVRFAKLCLFIGRHNHLQAVDGGGNGFELSSLFRGSPTIGVTLPGKYSSFAGRFFATDRSRFGFFSCRVGLLMFGFYLPRPLNRWIADRAYSRYAAELEQHFAALGDYCEANPINEENES